MHKYLITGGAGFIGSHLAEHLLNLDHEVFAIDNLSTGSMTNIAHLEDNPMFHFVAGELSESPDLDRLVASVDAIYHLAASVGVKNIMDNLVSSIKNNIDSTAKLLEIASKYNKKILLTSTSEVYGKNSQKPSAENDDLRMGETIKSRWSYACSKALDEYLSFAYFNERKLPVTVVRLFNTVGERQTDAYGMVIPTFIKQALRNESLTIHGDGKQSRCFIYVKDVVKAMQLLMDNEQTNGEVYNIGSKQVITIEELADKIIDYTRSKSIKLFIPYNEAYKVGFEDAERREPNTDKIEKLLNFAPQSNIDNIITKVTKYCTENNHITV
ncbi:MAG: GDP-mannose 4,6-dehydratase [bacterium]|nr:GDP-mannose 4,6-dehydratase [bacterium]